MANIKVLSLIPENLRDQLFSEILEELKAEQPDKRSKSLLDDITKHIQQTKNTEVAKEVIDDIVNQIM